MVINNRSVTIEGNSITFNCSQGFTQNKKYKNFETKSVTTSPGLRYIFSMNCVPLDEAMGMLYLTDKEALIAVVIKMTLSEL